MDDRLHGVGVKMDIQGREAMRVAGSQGEARHLGRWAQRTVVRCQGRMCSKRERERERFGHLTMDSRDVEENCVLRGEITSSEFIVAFLLSPI